MSGGMFEVHSDCPSCLVQGALIETWDAEAGCSRLGVPTGTRCRLCARTCAGEMESFRELAPGEGCPRCGAELDDASRDAHRCPFCGAGAALRETQCATALSGVAELEGALARWAAEEALGSVQELVDSAFVLTSAAAIHLALTRREIVETTLDVADYLFANGGSAGAAERAPLREDAAAARRQERISLPPRSAQRFGGPRDELFALASVAAADGEANEADRAALFRAARERQVAALEPHEIRVFRPNEIDPPPTLVDRERVLEEMLQMAWADGQMDESELRLIRDFGRVWGIDPERLREWIAAYSFGDANRFDRWLRRMAQFVFPEK